MSPSEQNISSPSFPSSRPTRSSSTSSTPLMSSLRSSRGSMVLYRLASKSDVSESTDTGSFIAAETSLPSLRYTKSPYPALAYRPKSDLSSMTSPSDLTKSKRGFVAYEYDPSIDNGEPDDDEDYLHDPNHIGKRHVTPGWRGFKNLGALGILVLGLLGVFLIYPVVQHFQHAGIAERLANAQGVNATGQVPRFQNLHTLVDPETPDEAKTRTGFDGEPYQLVFSDEFNQEGRTFNSGDDPYFEAMDMWYGVTADLEWYDPSQVTTRDGALVFTMDTVATTQPNLTPGSTAPFTTAENHNLTYRSGMVQSWNKLCFTSGYIEVAAILPGASGFDGYWPGIWTMGNLGRAGYRATTDALWPYSYDSCDDGTFPNQTPKGQQPFTLEDGAWPEYNSLFNALNGQRLSSCSCPNSDHPGPYGTFDGEKRYRGRGVPEIDIIEVQRDDQGTGNAASQSVQYAPLDVGYAFNQTGFIIYNDTITRKNGWPGSPLQEAVSGVTKVPEEGHQLSDNRRFVTYGIEYWANPDNRSEGFITWQVDGQATVQMLPSAVGPANGPGGTTIGQRLVPEEPMSIIINFGISNGWAPPKLETLTFPAEMLIDYVRIYQREGSVNVGCDPKDYPTADYINNHIDQYTDVNKTKWEYDSPKNKLYEGSC